MPSRQPDASHRSGDSSTADGDQQFNSNNRRAPDLPPAMARVAEVEAEVELFNATGARPHTERGPSVAAASVALSNTAPAGANLAQSDAHTATSQSPAADVDLLTSRVVRGLHSMLNHRGGAMTMRLDPPELGSLRVQMSIVNGAVTARFEADSAAAHSLLSRNLGALKTSLEQQGLTVERLSVHMTQPATQSGSFERFGDASRHERDAHDAADGQSRGRGEHQQQREQPRQEHTFEHAFSQTRAPLMDWMNP